MSEAAFDYARAARDAGWQQYYDNGFRWYHPETGKGYFGTVRALCFFLGIGPEWEAWKLEPYKKHSTE